VKELFEEAAKLQAICREHGWRSCIIGGVALQRWGEIRFTKDVDVSILTRFVNDEKVVDALLKVYPARIPNARDFALCARVLLLETTSGLGIDVALAALDYEAKAIERATSFEYQPGLFLTTCSAEDLIIFKAFADRPQDWLDIKGILVRQGKKLDMRYVYRELPPLCALKESPEIVERVRTMAKELIED
jgi:uncharacterized nucleotidyltransferase DUF6036